MKEIKDILNQENLQKTLKQEKMTAIGQKKSTSTREDFIKSIDDLFLKIELAYHYQFYKVFGTDEKLKEGKKLWATSLKNKTPSEILEAVEYVILNQSYLPTLTDIMKACEEIKRQDGYPSVEEAYIEARKSYQPRKDYKWSHPIVYFAGKKIGWSYLCEKDSKEAFEAFKKVFYSLKKKSKEGMQFEIKNINDQQETLPLNKKLFKELRKKYRV
tara:strand:+ start:12 stop:656 length:645 start_codon:yes stop_codon:yes gene_type:complete